jgi:hypothetical protein
MLTAPRGRPSRWSMSLTRVAVRAVPAGPVRDRYRRELVAELYGMSAGQQARQVLGVWVHAPALRAALTEPDHEEVSMPHKSIRCRLGEHHYRWFSTDDGSRYQRCDRCGQDRGPSQGGPGVFAGAPTGGGGGC